MLFPLSHPDIMVRHIGADMKRQQLEYSQQCLLARMARKVRRKLYLMRRGSISS
jgi:hypothetical protein